MLENKCGREGAGQNMQGRTFARERSDRAQKKKIEGGHNVPEVYLHGGEVIKHRKKDPCILLRRPC